MMSDKKEPTVDELIKLAQQAPEVSASDTEIERFIRDIDVQKDDKHVEGPVVYWAYRTWCRDLGIQPISNYLFFREFKKYFERSNEKHGGKTYLVKSEAFELTEQEWWDMKKFYRDKREIKKKLTKAKKPTQQG